MKPRGQTPEEDRANGWITEGVIKDVSGSGPWSVSLEGGTGCGVRDKGVEPKVGDILTIYGTFGYSFHGQALNGRLLWYLTPDEERGHRSPRLLHRQRASVGWHRQNESVQDPSSDARHHPKARCLNGN